MINRLLSTYCMPSAVLSSSHALNFITILWGKNHYYSHYYSYSQPGFKPRESGTRTWHIVSPFYSALTLREHFAHSCHSVWEVVINFECEMSRLWVLKENFDGVSCPGDNFRSRVGGSRGKERRGRSSQEAMWAYQVPERGYQNERRENNIQLHSLTVRRGCLRSAMGP